MLEGLMMERPLAIMSILAYAADTNPDGQVVSRLDGRIVRLAYPELRRRVGQLANALKQLGIGPGDRVATLAWNDHRHFELYYAIAGIGAVCHTINPRLACSQISWLIDHAEDRLLFCDAGLLALARAAVEGARLKPGLVVLGGHDGDQSDEHASYEGLLRDQDSLAEWPEFPEGTASGLCYTSGTTGRPKGVLYSHRSTVLHALSVVVGAPRSFGAGQRILPAVPMFHANAWSLPFSGPLSGASLVMPGPDLDGASLFELMDAEGVTASWGVPTVWTGLLSEMEARRRAPRALQTILAGGSAVPPAMIETLEGFGVEVLHGWGMTELSPVGSVTRARPGLAPSQARALKVAQGRPLFGVDLRILGPSGMILEPGSGEAGELVARGNSVAADYYRPEEAQDATDGDGWFRTGDTARIAGDGDLTIVDRTKDMIKSGGEWIPSIDLENAAMSHPGVLQAAAIAVPHPRWGERPLLCVVSAVGAPPAEASLRAHLAASLPRWQVPDSILMLEKLPMTATGKVSKLELRAIVERLGLPNEGGGVSRT